MDGKKGLEEYRPVKNRPQKEVSALVGYSFCWLVVTSECTLGFSRADIA